MKKSFYILTCISLVILISGCKRNSNSIIFQSSDFKEGDSLIDKLIINIKVDYSGEYTSSTIPKGKNLIFPLCPPIEIDDSERIAGFYLKEVDTSIKTVIYSHYELSDSICGALKNEAGGYAELKIGDTLIYPVVLNNEIEAFYVIQTYNKLIITNFDCLDDKNIGKEYKSKLFYSKGKYSVKEVYEFKHDNGFRCKRYIGWECL